jgi:hypothetical protein
LGLDPLKTATTVNTSATVANTQATAALTTRIGTFGSLATSPTGGGGGAVSPEVSALIKTGAVTADSITQQASLITKLTNNIGTIAQTAAAGVAIGGGIKQGGALGGLAAAGGAVSLAGTGIQLASKVGLLSGQLAAGLGNVLPGIGLGISLLTPLISSLLPDPKVARANQIDKELATARYAEPTALSLEFDQRGNFADRDSRGLIRSSDFTNFPVSVRQPARYNGENGPLDVPGAQLDPFGNPESSRPVQQITIHMPISAIDTKDLIARAGDFAEVIRHGISNGQGDSLVSEIRSQTRTS